MRVRMTLCSFCTLVVFCSFSRLAAQSSAAGQYWTTENREATEEGRFYARFYQGLRANLRPSDLTLMTAGIMIEQQEKWQGVSLPPSRFDLSLSSQLARADGKQCLGAISPLYYPRAVATFRLGGMLVLDALSGKNYAPASYAKLIRFHQALLYNTAFTHLAKRNLSRTRPDGSDTQSFFSGHTSTVFATSTFLYLELRDFFDAKAAQGNLPLMSAQGWKWLSAGALFGWASYVGYSRIHDRKHYPTDVVVGAASGALISYLVYPHPHRFESSAQTRPRFNTSFSLSRFNLSVDF